MPGSVHCVNVKNSIVINVEPKKRRGTAGVIYHIYLKMNMKYGISTPIIHMYM
jgi:hypothetical protein